MPRRIENETDRHREALRYYQSLGETRSLADVAREFSVSQTSAQRWARSFDWNRRTAEHDAQTARRTIEIAEQEGIETDAKSRVRNLKLVKMAMLQLAKAVAGGEVRMNVRDLDHLMRLEQDLLAPPGSIDASGGGGVSADLEHLSVGELWSGIAEETEAIMRLVEHDHELQRLVSEGAIRPLPELPAHPHFVTVAEGQR